jgi:hypothetical protein
MPPKRKDMPTTEMGAFIKPAKDGKKMDGAVRKPNAWVRFVSDYAIANDMTYSCALGDHFLELKELYRNKDIPKSVGAKPKARAKAKPKAKPMAMPMVMPEPAPAPEPVAEVKAKRKYVRRPRNPDGTFA